MSDNKTFYLAVLVSILLHSIFFLGLPYTPFSLHKKIIENPKITYYKIEEVPERKKIESLKKKEPEILEKLPKVTKEEILKPPEAVGKEKVKEIKKKQVRTSGIEKVVEKKIETIIREEQNEIKKAIYINYYRAVREKIRQYVDKNYPRNRNLGEGEVFLTFDVASNGQLIQVKIVDNQSSNNMFLRKIAIDSIRDADPFPPFPKDMTQYQITFNVVISFELN